MKRLVQSIQDYILNLSLNSNIAGATPSPSLPSATKDHGDDDIRLDLDLVDLQIIYPAQHTEQELTSILGDDLSDRFAGAAASNVQYRHEEESKDEEDQDKKLIVRAKDAACLNPSPPSDAGQDHNSSASDQDKPNRMWIYSCALKAAAASATDLFRVKAFLDAMPEGEDNAKSSAVSSSLNTPRSGSYKVNVDGSTCFTTQESGFGGLVRDSYGNWVIGFTGYVGKSEILYAEMLGILLGIKIAKSLGITSLTCESDSREAVTLANLDPHLAKVHKYGPLIHDIKQLISSPDWNVAVVHILRDANRCADFLAKLGRHGGDTLTVRDKAPNGLRPHLLADKTGDRPPMQRPKRDGCTCVGVTQLIKGNKNCPIHRFKENLKI